MRLELRTTPPRHITRLEDWVQRECRGYEPPASAGHKVVLSVFALLAVAGMVAIIWRAMV